MINAALVTPLFFRSSGHTVMPTLGSQSRGWLIQVGFSEIRPARETALSLMIEAMDLIGQGRMATVDSWEFKQHEDLDGSHRLPPFSMGEGQFLAYENPVFDRKPFAKRAADLIRQSLQDGSQDYRPDYVVIDGPSYVISESEHASNLHQMRIAWYEKAGNSFLAAVRVHWPRSEEEGSSPFLPFIDGLMTLLPGGKN